MGTTENQENESANITKKKSKLPIILAVIGVIVVIFLALCAAAFAFIFLHGASDRKLKNQLSLGEKYVSELDYDNAILAYEKAIELEETPQNPDTGTGVDFCFGVQLRQRNQFAEVDIGCREDVDTTISLSRFHERG